MDTIWIAAAFLAGLLTGIVTLAALIRRGRLTRLKRLLQEDDAVLGSLAVRIDLNPFRRSLNCGPSRRSVDLAHRQLVCAENAMKRVRRRLAFGDMSAKAEDRERDAAIRLRAAECILDFCDRVIGPHESRLKESYIGLHQSVSELRELISGLLELEDVSEDERTGHVQLIANLERGLEVHRQIIESSPTQAFKTLGSQMEAMNAALRSVLDSRFSAERAP